MKNGMFIGLAVGMITGACLVSNSQKARQMVSSAQEQIKSKFQKQSQDMQSGCCGAMDSQPSEEMSQSQE